MKLSTKRLFANRYSVIVVFAFLITVAVSWLMVTDIIALLTQNRSSLERASLIRGTFHFDNFMTSAFYIVDPFLTLLSAMLCMNFIGEKNGYFKFAYMRGQRYSEFVRKRVIAQIASICTIMFSVYLFIFLIGVISSNTILDINTINACYAFSEIFGKTQTVQTVLLRFLLDGVLKCIYVPFVYGLFAISLSFLTSKKYLCVIIPPAYFFIMCILVGPLHLALFNPIYTVGSINFGEINLWLPLVSLVPLIAFSVAVIEYRLRRGEKLGV